MLRVITLNCNGLRSAIGKGLLGWLARQRADVVCLQEIRLGAEGIPDRLKKSSWHIYHAPTKKLGYSGTAVLSRRPALGVEYGFGVEEFDDEGRYCAVDLGSVYVASIYSPSGSSGEHRQASKDRYLQVFLRHCQRLARKKAPVLMCGDFNIAHTRKDLKNWSGNRKNSGFLPHEREWMNRLLGNPEQSNDSEGALWRDVFRLLNQKESQYTWWSNRGRAWENNTGWRIDYQIATPTLAEKAIGEKIYKKKRYSDHSPLIIDYDFELPD